MLRGGALRTAYEQILSYFNAFMENNSLEKEFNSDWIIELTAIVQGQDQCVCPPSSNTSLKNVVFSANTIYQTCCPYVYRILDTPRSFPLPSDLLQCTHGDSKAILAVRYHRSSPGLPQVLLPVEHVCNTFFSRCPKCVLTTCPNHLS